MVRRFVRRRLCFGHNIRPRSLGRYYTLRQSEFRAPGLGQAYFSKIITNVIAGVTEDIGVFPVNSRAAVALGAKPLRDETSVNLSSGVALTPVRDFTVTADYFYIQLKHRIVLGATYDDDTTRAILARNGITDIAGVQYFTNGLDTRTQGVDLTANYTMPAGNVGRFDFLASVNFTDNKITRVDPLPEVLANSSEPGILDGTAFFSRLGGSVTAEEMKEAIETAQHAVLKAAPGSGTTLTAILLSIATMNWGVALVLAVLTFPALLRASVVAVWRRSAGYPMSPREKTALQEISTDDLEAYTLFLQGVELIKRGFNREFVEGALQKFQAAVDRDPRFAQATCDQLSNLGTKIDDQQTVGHGGIYGTTRWRSTGSMWMAGNATRALGLCCAGHT